MQSENDQRKGEILVVREGEAKLQISTGKQNYMRK